MPIARTCALAVLLLATLAGCSTATPGSAAPAGPAPAPGPVTTRDAPAAGVDACALLPEAEITALIGDNEHEAFTSDMSDSACKWENKTTYYSVTLSVGSHGTAAPDLAENEALLGPAEPIGDGMQFRAGQVEFVVGDRLCYLNVAIEPNSLGDRDQAVRLAPMVRDRLAAGGS